MKADEIDDRMTPIEVFDISGDGGILKRITAAGGALIPRGATAHLSYTGRLTDGNVFDCSSARGDSFSFKVGRRVAVLALDLAVVTMRKGEKCILVCKPEYAYGKVRVGPVPANSTVEYHVELLGWENQNQNQSGIAILPFVTISIFLLLLACIARSLMG
jgi:FK506-binding protein 4/5